MFSQQRKQLVGNWKSGASQSFVCEARRPCQVGCSTQCFFASCFVSIVLIILLKVCLVLIPINGTVKSGQQHFPTPCSLKKILTWQRQMRNNYIQNQRMKIMHKTENMNHNLSTINKFYKNQSKDHTVRTRKRSKTLRKDMNQRTAQHIPILTENTLDAAPSYSCARPEQASCHTRTKQQQSTTTGETPGDRNNNMPFTTRTTTRKTTHYRGRHRSSALQQKAHKPHVAACKARRRIPSHIRRIPSTKPQGPKRRSKIPHPSSTKQPSPPLPGNPNLRSQTIGVGVFSTMGGPRARRPWAPAQAPASMLQWELGIRT